ncbi:homocysteine S-methyltransferase family protein [Nannocystaceae bacterium ST9]
MTPTPLLLDGAMATELSRRGFSLDPPLFSARALIEAPELVEQIHADYIRAGAQVITTNSFGLHVSTLAKAGLAARAQELVERSVITIERARQLAAHDDGKREHGWAKIRIAGSLPPTRAKAEPRELAVAEQRTLAGMLVSAGVDLLLLETYTTIADVAIALEAVAEFEVPVWLAVVAGVPGSPRPDGSRMLGGDDFDSLFAAIEAAPPQALLINCTQIDAVPAALRAIEAARSHAGAWTRALTLGLYPHLGRHSWDGTWHERFLEPGTYAEQIQAWILAHPSFELVGACCGSTPEYIDALRCRLQPDKDARERSFVRLAGLVP